MSLWWHPRATHAPQQGTAVAFSEPSPPIYVDDGAAISREEAADDATTSRADAEAALVEELADEALQLPEKDRLRVAWPTGPLPAAVAAQQTAEVLTWFAQRPSQMRLAQIPAHLRSQAEQILVEHEQANEVEQRRLRAQAASREPVRL